MYVRVQLSAIIVCKRCERSVQSKIDALIHGCTEDGELRTGIVCWAEMGMLSEVESSRRGVKPEGSQGFRTLIGKRMCQIRDF